MLWRDWRALWFPELGITSRSGAIGGKEVFFNEEEYVAYLALLSEWCGSWARRHFSTVSSRHSHDRATYQVRPQAKTKGEISMLSPQPRDLGLSAGHWLW